MRPLIVLYIHKIPYPFYTGTNQRIVSMVRFLRRYYRLGLVMPEYHHDVNHLKNIFDEVWYGGNYQGFFGRISKYITNQIYNIMLRSIFNNDLKVFSNNPLGRYNIQAAYTLYKVCSKQSPALIISQRVINTVLSTAIAKKFNIPIIVDTHDLYKLQIDEKQEKIKVNLKHYPQITSQNEKDLLQLHDALIAIQYQEATILRYHFPEKKIITALHPVEKVSLQENTVHIYTNTPVLLFVASSSPHNKDAILYFIKNHLDCIAKNHSNVVLNICGDVGETIQINHPNMSLLGRVDDLEPFYKQATVVINPVRHGSGLKIKTIDALAFGKCLVTTPNGAEGLPYTDDVLVCVNAEQFGEKIVNLLNDRESIRSYELAAYNYAKTYLTPEKCYAELKNLIQELLKVKTEAKII